MKNCPWALDPQNSERAVGVGTTQLDFFFFFAVVLRRIGSMPNPQGVSERSTSVKANSFCGERRSSQVQNLYGATLDERDDILCNHHYFLVIKRSTCEILYPTYLELQQQTSFWRKFTPFCHLPSTTWRSRGTARVREFPKALAASSLWQRCGQSRTPPVAEWIPWPS